MSGSTGTALIGPYQPNLRGLLDSQDSAFTHPMSSILSDLVRRVELKGLAEKAAAVYVVYRLTQWQVYPSAETYNNLPPWFYPVAPQLMTGHPIWSTTMIWGKLRDIVINDQETYCTEELRPLYICSLNVNWPYRDQDILVFDGAEVKMSDVFTRHINNLANWSLDELFQRRHPELRHACKFTELPGQSSMQNVNRQQ